MRAAVECRYNATTITIDDALRLRDAKSISKSENLAFTCLVCSQLLRAHRAGDNSAAHFEHRKQNPDCPHSAGPIAANTGGFEETFGIDDKRAIEGYEIDRLLTAHARNAGLVKECKKRDSHTCQVCRFKLTVHGRNVIECHHLNPVALSGEREVTINELVCLCPTCHRIAHTRITPLSVEEIRRARADL
jgi:hypothetical protein